MPPEYWESVLNDPRADDRPRPTEPSIRTLRLAEIHQHILRVSCTRCGRTVEIQKADAGWNPIEILKNHMGGGRR